MKRRKILGITLLLPLLTVGLVLSLAPQVTAIRPKQEELSCLVGHLS